MIFAGSLKSLAAEYRRTWSGKSRTAFTTEAEGIKLRFDFFRYLGRQAIKNREDKMILIEKIEKDDQLVLVFKGNDAGKSIERLVAEVIYELGRNFQGVPCHAIHFASLKHPLSCSQRLREIRKAWKKEWIARHCQDGLPLTDGYIDPIRFVKKENKYYFLVQEFFPWLRKTYIEKAGE